MKTTPVRADHISQQVILDYRSNILLNIYQVQNKFAFRYFQASAAEEHATDPIADSDNFNWGYGLYDSPETAISEAREHYLAYGVHRLHPALT